MKITSTSFEEGQELPVQSGKTTGNLNPPLVVDDLPMGTVTWALMMDDPDAPNGTFDHWVVWNIPVAQNEIPEGWKPDDGVKVGANGWGEQTYGGPQPPSGTHRYFFKAYALDAAVGLDPGAYKAELERAMEGHILGEARLMGTFTARS